MKLAINLKKLNVCIAGFVIALTAAAVANATTYTKNAKRSGTSSRSAISKKHYRLASNTRNSPQAYSSIAANAKQTELRSWEFRTAPVALLARWYTLDVSYRFTAHIAAGPSAVIYDAVEQGNMLAPSYKGNAYGLHANYYLTSVEASGWYSGLHAYQESYRSYPEGYPGYEDRKGYRGNVTAGYQVKWSQINLMTGLGMEYRSHNVVETSRYSGTQPETRESGWGPTVEIKLGFEI